jgi:hypothetical protein
MHIHDVEVTNKDECVTVKGSTRFLGHISISD